MHRVRGKGKRVTVLCFCAMRVTWPTRDVQMNPFKNKMVSFKAKIESWSNVMSLK